MMQDGLLYEMKGEELQDIIKDKAATINVVVNEAAIQRYKARTAVIKGFI
jgi:hypothetical protein